MAPTPCAHRLYFGTEEPPEHPRLLRAGGLTAEFIGGELRHIRYQGREVLRAIAWLVRDRDWGTYAPDITDLHIEEGAASFHVSYHARCVDTASGQQLRYQVHIQAEAGELHGTLRVEAHYQADTRFLTCRNGFCLLHPIDGLAGQAVSIGHPDGSIEQAHFPAEIAPWQPFKEIASMQWTVAEGVSASCHLHGDVFEMEDHRNWSDASYKTYVRPLSRPWPYWIEQGETGSQSVRLNIAGSAAPLPPACGDIELVLESPPEARRHPAIGMLLRAGDCEAVLRNIEHLRALAPQVLLCQFDPTAGDGLAALTGFAAIAQRYRARYVLECVVPGQHLPAVELAQIAAWVSTAELTLDGIAVCPAVDRLSVPPGSPWPPCPPLADIYAAARASFPGMPLGGGMFSYFTELNRKRPPSHMLDWVTHATNPIVHAAGDTAVMQTLEALPHITGSCRAIIGANQRYWLGPITLAMRQNPYGSKTMDNPDGRRMPMAGSDPRERALFGAAWLLAYAATVANAEAEIEVLTAGPLSGPRGLTGPAPSSDDGSNQPYPMYYVVQALAQLAGHARLHCSSSAPGKLLGIGAVSAHGEHTLWVVNLGAAPQTLRIRGGTPHGARLVRVIDAQGVRELDQPAPPDAIALAPYACMALRWQGSPPPSP